MSERPQLKRDVLPIPDITPVGHDDVRREGPGHGVPADRAAAAAGRARRTSWSSCIDDVGFGASSAFGGPIRTPNAERLAAKGLKYNRFHTTALCSPTRAALLSGRNHHTVGMGGITEIATSAPGLQLDPAEHLRAARRDAEAERLLDGAVRQVPRGAGLGDEPDGAVPRTGRPAAASSTSTASSAARRISTTRRSTRARSRSSPRRRPKRATTSWPT